MKSRLSSDEEDELEDDHSPYSLLHKIYQLKIWQMLLILIICSILFYILDYLHSTQQLPNSVAWVGVLPLRALGDACFTALVVGFTYEWLVRRESAGQLDELIQRKLDGNQKVILRQIPRALLTDRAVIEDVLKESKLDEVLRTSLQIRLGDNQLGNDVYEGLLQKTFAYDERWLNYAHKVTIASITDDNAASEVREKYYQAYIDFRYETRLRRSQFVFTCATTIEEYDLLLRDPAYEIRWMFELTKEFSFIDEKVFDVEFVKIDDIDLEITRENRDRFRIVAQHERLGSKIGTVVTVNYRYKVKLQKRGHLLSINVVYPTKNISIEFDYANTDIHFVNVLDFFVSTRNPMIRYAPERGRPHKIEVALNEWVFPKGGVTFVWVLRSEMTTEFLDLLRAQGGSD